MPFFKRFVLMKYLKQTLLNETSGATVIILLNSNCKTDGG